MSLEFVEPEAPDAGGPVAPAVPQLSTVPGRLVGVAVAAAGVLTIVATRSSLYAIVRSRSIVDFDGTTTTVDHIPVDAYGHPAQAVLGATRGLTLGDFTLVAGLPGGVSYGHWWLGLGIALLVVALWCLARPRSAVPTPVATALGGLLLGSAGAAWLTARTVVLQSVPQIRLEATPAVGLWLLVVAGALALLAPLARVVAPHVRLPRRR